MLDELFRELQPQVGALVAGLQQAVDGAHHEMEAITKPTAPSLAKIQQTLVQVVRGKAVTLCPTQFCGSSASA